MIEPVYEDIPADLIKTETEHEKWLREQIKRIDPYEGEQGNEGAYTRLLEKLVLELREDLSIANKLLEARNEVIEAIPHCPDHGGQCLPHALLWVIAARYRMNGQLK